MSNTHSIIDRVLPWCPGWQRSSGQKNLLKLAEKALDELYNFDDDHMIYRGTDNKGFPPYLITVANTYRYEVKAANLSCGNIVRTIGGTSYTFIARKVIRVMIDVTSNKFDYNRTWVGAPYIYSMNPYTTKTDRIYMRDVKVTSQLGYENSPPTVDFVEDPGSETTKYFIEFLIGPPRLTSESIPMPIPTRYESAVEKFILGSVQQLENGRSNDNLTDFYSRWVPEFREENTSAANIEPDETPLRIC